MDTITRAALNSVFLAIFGSALAAISAYFWRGKLIADKEKETIAADHQLVLARLTETETQLRVIVATMLPINAAMQAVIVKQMTHIHTPELDELMTRIGPPSTLTPEEEVRMFELIEARTIDMHSEITDEERDAAAILPVIMKRATAEMTRLAKSTIHLKLISLTATVENTEGQQRAVLLSSLNQISAIPLEEETLHARIARLQQQLTEHDIWEKSPDRVVTWKESIADLFKRTAPAEHNRRMDDPKVG